MRLWSHISLDLPLPLEIWYDFLRTKCLNTLPCHQITEINKSVTTLVSSSSKIHLPSEMHTRRVFRTPRTKTDQNGWSIFHTPSSFCSSQFRSGGQRNNHNTLSAMNISHIQVLFVLVGRLDVSRLRRLNLKVQAAAPKLSPFLSFFSGIITLCVFRLWF
jgi:hypothetical protein